MPAFPPVSLPTAPAATAFPSTGRRAALRGRLLRAVLGIDPAEATFARRGFAVGAPETRERLERVGLTFLEGYHAALEGGDLAARLDETEPAMRGFAFEGAGMAAALLDLLTPWRRGRLAALLRGAGAPHAYMVHVGAGWALARLRRPFHEVPRGMDPLLGWLAADGYGFHEGYFHPRRFADGCEQPARLSGYALRGFDQGLGRSLWFVHAADPERIGRALARFPLARREGVWSGVGLACAYAGGPRGDEARALAVEAGAHGPALAQGAALAAEARRLAGNPSAHTDQACRIRCGVSAEEAAAVTNAARDGLAPRGAIPAYGVWRMRVQEHFAHRSHA